MCHHSVGHLCWHIQQAGFGDGDVVWPLVSYLSQENVACCWKIAYKELPWIAALPHCCLDFRIVSSFPSLPLLIRFLFLFCFFISITPAFNLHSLTPHYCWQEGHIKQRNSNLKKERRKTPCAATLGCQTLKIIFVFTALHVACNTLRLQLTADGSMSAHRTTLYWAWEVSWFGCSLVARFQFTGLSDTHSLFHCYKPISFTCILKRQRRGSSNSHMQLRHAESLTAQNVDV